VLIVNYSVDLAHCAALPLGRCNCNAVADKQVFCCSAHCCCCS